MYLIFSLPVNFIRKYPPLLSPGNSGKIISTEMTRFGYNQFWYLTFYKLKKSFGFGKARNAYLFFEGLGQWNKENFYIDYLIYIVYSKIGTRWTTIIVNSLLIFVFAWVFNSTNTLSVYTIVALIFIIISSHYYTDIFIQLVKPEIWGWPFYFICIFAAIKGYNVLFILSGIVAILCNFTIALLLVFNLLVYFIIKTQISYWNVSLFLFYFLYTLWRMLPSLRSGSHKRLYQHIHKEEAKKSLSFNAWQWLFLCLYLAIPGVWYYSTKNLTHVLLFPICAGVLYFIFYRIIMFGDYHTIFRMLLLNSLLLFCTQWDFPTFIYLCFFLIIGYLRIDPFMKYAKEKTSLTGQTPILNRLQKLLDPLSPGSRVIKEKHNPGRCFFFDKRFSWQFLPALRYATIEKNINIIPNIVMYDSHQYTDLIKNTLSDFNKKMGIKRIKKTMEELGANFIICYSQDFRLYLEEIGFSKVSHTEDWSGLFKGSENIPPIYIYKSPWNFSIVENSKNLQISYNKITFEGNPGLYEIKFKWYPHFKLCEDAEEYQIANSNHRLGFFKIKKYTNKSATIKF